jgi:hypothetical protein
MGCWMIGCCCLGLGGEGQENRPFVKYCLRFAYVFVCSQSSPRINVLTKQNKIMTGCLHGVGVDDSLYRVLL